jgi:hypothetical protein
MQAFPELKDNQVAVMRAEASTGHIVDIEFNLAINDEQEVFTIYESFEEAMYQINLMLASRNDMEYLIYGTNENVLKYINPYDEKG